MDFFKEQLEKASNGRIMVELYFNGVFETETEVLDMVRLGSLQGSRSGLFPNVMRGVNLFISE